MSITSQCVSRQLYVSAFLLRHRQQMQCDNGSVGCERRAGGKLMQAYFVLKVKRLARKAAM